MNTYSISQVSRLGNLDSKLILRQYRLDLMSRFVQIKSDNSNTTQKEITKELGFSDNTLSRYRKDTKMTSPYNSTNPRKNVQNRQNTLKDVNKKRYKVLKIVEKRRKMP